MNATTGEGNQPHPSSRGKGASTPQGLDLTIGARNSAFILTRR
jgi:hypothetical protein